MKHLLDIDDSKPDAEVCVYQRLDGYLTSVVELPVDRPTIKRDIVDCKTPSIKKFRQIFCKYGKLRSDFAKVLTGNKFVG